MSAHEILTELEALVERGAAIENAQTNCALPTCYPRARGLTIAGRAHLPPCLHGMWVVSVWYPFEGWWAGPRLRKRAAALFTRYATQQLRGAQVAQILKEIDAK